MKRKIVIQRDPVDQQLFEVRLYSRRRTVVTIAGWGLTLPEAKDMQASLRATSRAYDNDGRVAG